MTYAQKLAYEKAKRDAIDKAAVDGMVELRANAHVQRAMWLMVCTIADAYGFGPERMKPFFEHLQQNSEELEKMVEEVDEDYAWEKLRLKAERVTGIEISYFIDEQLKRVRMSGKEAEHEGYILDTGRGGVPS